MNSSLIGVAIGLVFIATLAGILSVPLLLRRQALSGDLVAHALLPGLVGAFMITGIKETSILLMGAVFTAWIALRLLAPLQKHPRIKSDGAMAVLISGAYALGVFMLSLLQKTENATQAGLDRYLLGSAAALQWHEVLWAGGIFLLIVGGILPNVSALQLWLFDPDQAKMRGINTHRLERGLEIGICLAVMMAVQFVGIVLAAALLIAPALIARPWANSLLGLWIGAAAISAFAALTGTWISFQSPGMPTGPWIVLSLAIFWVLSYAFWYSKRIIFQAK